MGGVPNPHRQGSLVSRGGAPGSELEEHHGQLRTEVLDITSYGARAAADSFERSVGHTGFSSLLYVQAMLESDEVKIIDWDESCLVGEQVLPVGTLEYAGTDVAMKLLEAEEALRNARANFRPQDFLMEAGPTTDLPSLIQVILETLGAPTPQVEREQLRRSPEESEATLQARYEEQLSANIRQVSYHLGLTCMHHLLQSCRLQG